MKDEAFLITSDPKLFEPIRCAMPLHKAVGHMIDLLAEYRGQARGDLVMVLYRRAVDGGEITLGGQNVQIAEWFISVLARWTGDSWENVFPGSVAGMVP